VSPAVAVIGPDASNTSLCVTVGDAAFAVKLMRRCRPGIQPEVEVGSFVAEQTSWRGTPRLYGWLDYEPADGDPAATLATIHEFATGCDAAWDRLLGLVRADGSGSLRLLTLVDALASVTAEMHASLASRSDVAAFAPHFPTAADRHAQAGSLAAHADAVCRMIMAPGPSLPPEISARLRAVASRRAELASRLEAGAEIDAAAATIRVHGDYHLGQVLLTPDDRPLVIDFEGEPGRSLDERRAKTSACKDVAGMCRSLDYLLRCAARAGGPVYAAADAANLQRRYVAGYARRVSGQPWWPARPADADAVLAAYVLDKALYELAYELRSRPDWIDVPLAAVEALLAHR
jgi:maltose alpha-D-glucosyltransferase/alpha-amylase